MRADGSDHLKTVDVCGGVYLDDAEEWAGGCEGYLGADEGVCGEVPQELEVAQYHEEYAAVSG